MGAVAIIKLTAWLCDASTSTSTRSFQMPLIGTIAFGLPCGVGRSARSCIGCAVGTRTKDTSLPCAISVINGMSVALSPVGVSGAPVVPVAAVGSLGEPVVASGAGVNLFGGSSGLVKTSSSISSSEASYA